MRLLEFEILKDCGDMELDVKGLLNDLPEWSINLHYTYHGAQKPCRHRKHTWGIWKEWERLDFVFLDTEN